MENKNSSDKLLGELPVSKAIIKIAVPAIIAMLIMAIYNFVDTLFIGMLNSDEALAAVSVAFPIMNLMGALGQVLGAGSAAVIGRAFGRGDDDNASKVATTVIFSGFVCAFIFMLIGIVFIEPIFKMFGATDRIIPFAKEYGIWMFIGALFTIPNQIFNNIARAETKALLSMIALMTGAIINIILDPIFMFEFSIGNIELGLGMGLEGASIATTIAQFVSFVFLSVFFFTGKSKVKISPKNFKPSKAIYAETLKSGAPVGVMQLLSSIAVSVTNIVAVWISPDTITGDNMIASYGVVLKIITIIQYINIGFLQGYQPIASYAYGAKNKERFFTAYAYAKKFILSYALIMTILVQVFSKTLIMIFSSSPDIIEFGSYFIIANNIFFVMTSFSFIIMLTSQATGNGKLGATISFARQGFFYIPALIILPKIFGFYGIFFAQPLSDVLTFILGITIFKKYQKSLDEHFLQK